MNKLKTLITDKKMSDILFIFTCIVYALVLFRGLLFKYVSPFEIFSPDRYEYIGYNLIPFNDSGMNYRIDMFINTALFIPFGFLLSMKSKKNIKSLLLMFLPLVASVIFESLQYILHLGAADITDTIMNSIGGCVGFLIYLISYKIFGNRADRFYIIAMSVVAITALFLLY